MRVAVVQAASVLFNRDACIARACDHIAEGAAAGARLILLPEAFIPGYPRGLTFGAPIGSRSDAGRALFAEYWEHAVEVPGPAIAPLVAAARAAEAIVAIGIVERDTTGGRATLYCSLLILGPDGSVLGVHRKLKPTAAERIVWGEGDGQSLRSYDTPVGRLGGLICWENLMPLARMALYQQGVDLWLAPTADARDSWQATLRHIACEGRCFVLGANQFVTKDDYPATLRDTDALADAPEVLCRGGSVIISPFGDVLAGPLWDREGMLVADLDLTDIVRGRFDFDVTGHYARPDILGLQVKTT